MPDMLVRLYDLPDASPYYQRAAAAGVTARRADPWDHARYRRFVEGTFGELWAVEADLAYRHSPITAFVAEREGRIVGFAAYECTRRGFFGPTGVMPDERGAPAGRCSSAAWSRCERWATPTRSSAASGRSGTTRSSAVRS